MRLPNALDLGTPRRMALTAFAITVIVGICLGIQDYRHLAVTLGDTDDATRLVLMRGLLSGQGWYDQHLMRFQPPVGVYMHWSRLLDGGLAALDRLFRLVLAPGAAETATRFTWPLLWIFPTALAGLMIARRLGAGALAWATPLIAAVIMVADQQLYAQYHPGRVDHHDAQMALCLLALAGAVQRRPAIKGAILAGLATGLGLAIGLEALAFDALIGACFALRFAFEPEERRAVQAYGLSLLISTLAAYGLQTPPARWGIAACDALAVNSALALAVAGAGLAIAATATSRAARWVRFVAIAAVGALALAVYLGLDPNCRAGPFADVDPRIKPLWLVHVNEIRPWTRFVKQQPAEGISLLVPWCLGLLAWAGLGLRRERRTDDAWLLTGACLIVGVVAAAGAIRMTGYAEWFAVGPIAAAGAEVAARFRREGLLAPVAAGVVASPMVATALVLIATGHAAWEQKKPKRPPPPPDRCFDTQSYRALAAAGPPGLVLSEIDLGPFVLAHTRDSALSAPYHRMSWGILKAHAVLAAPVDKAAAMARQLGVAYVLECRVHSFHADRDNIPKNSLQKRLDAGRPPAWLQPLSPPNAPLQAYRVRPAFAPQLAAAGPKT